MKPLSDGQMQLMPERHQIAANDEPHCECASVLAAIDSLPERQQEVIRLKFQAGLSYKEIAAVMDLTANHVGVLIHMGIKAIRDKMNPASGAVPQTQACARADEGRSR